MRVETKKIFLLSLLTSTLVACGDKTTTPDGPDKDKFSSQSKEELSMRVIYGEDDRLDLFQVQQKSLIDLADSTMALIQQSDLTDDGSGRTKIRTTKFANSYRLPLCPNERFREQETAAFCSGFLVAPNLVATAGHCVQSQGSSNSDCATTRFVFGFNMKSESDVPTSVATGEIYKCRRIVAHKLDNMGADYALIELDRPVVNHAPLRIRREGAPGPNELMTVIGHPSGLPTKVSGNAQVRKVLSTHFVTNLDTYGGNSGSAVFNSITGEVEGILVRGEADFVVQGNCMASKVCESTACRGEDVTRISNIANIIPDQN